MKKYFLEIYQYENWANMQVLKKVEQAEETQLPDKLKSIFSHLIIAQKIWLARLQNIKIEIGVWQNIPIGNWKQELEESYKSLVGFINKQEDFTQVIAYQNSKGESFKTSIEDILQHLLLHSAYHRGQIVTQLKTISKDLPITDYIFYVRN